MTLRDYAKIFRHRWPLIVACTLLAAAVMWLVTPADTDTTQKVGSYTATATLLVGSRDGGDAASNPAALGRVALYVTTGEIPEQAAAALEYDGEPAVLASGITVVQDPTAGALTVSATASDGERAASVANAFATQTVEFFDERRPGAGNATVSVLQEATPIANQPAGGFVVPPGRAARTAIAAGLGLLLGLALALVMHHFDARLRSRDQVHESLRVPIIAEVPKLSRAQRARGRIAVVDEPMSVAADGYRAARAALTHVPSHEVPGEWSDEGLARGARASRGGAPRVVLVTSAHASEGKTTSVANLAASFAEAGQRVLVLDGDLRSPDAHNMFDLPQGAGISDYLSDPLGTPIEDLARATSVPGVQLITAGTRLDRPTSLANRMGPLLAAARDMADVVLIDSPPLLAASDVFDILPMVDTVLLVVRSGRLTDAAGARAAEVLARFHVPVIGAVLIAAPASRGDGYGYGYGKGYGYGDSKKRRSGGDSGQALPESVPAGGLSELMDESEPPTRRARRGT